MESTSTKWSAASADPNECLRVLAELRKIGFCEDDFQILHHLDGRPATFAVFEDYCKKRLQFQEDKNNHRVHKRLKYVLESCSDGKPPHGKNFRDLVEKSLKEFPPIPKKTSKS